MQHTDIAVRVGRKGLRESTGRKDGLRSKGRARKAGVAEQGTLTGIILITYFISSLQFIVTG